MAIVADDEMPPGGTAAERHASWLELFFDLTVVASAAQLAHRLHEADSLGQVAVCAAMFYAIWSVWTTTSVFANVAGDRTPARTVLATMLGIAVMAASVPAVWPELLPAGTEHPEGRTVAFTLAYLCCRGLASASANRHGQVIAFWPATQGGLSAPWLVALFVPTEVAYWLWGLAIVLDLATSMLAAGSSKTIERITESFREQQRRDERRRLRRLRRMVLAGRPLPPGAGPIRTPVSVAEVERGHLDERLGLFVIIVLGEALAQVVAANTEVEWHLPVVVASVAAFLLLITLWGLTTLYGFNTAPRTTAPLEPRVALPAHLAVTAAVVSIAAGLGELVPGAAEHLATKERWYLFGGLALYFATSAVTGLAGRAPLRWFLGWAVPCLAAAVAVALLGDPLPGWSLALLALILPAWLYSYDAVSRSARAPR